MPDSPITVREERPDDVAAVRMVNDRAFDQPLEGRIVDALRAHGAVRLSLVAEVEGLIVGHILFSPVTTAGAEGLGLGPMAVLPEAQRRGVGAALIAAGLERLHATADSSSSSSGTTGTTRASASSPPAPRSALRVGRARRDLHGLRHRPGGDRRRPPACSVYRPE